MKKEITVLICDKCGAEIRRPSNAYYEVSTDEYSFIGVKAMFSNAGVGSKYDLCEKCTLEIAKQFVKKLEKEMKK